MKKAQIQCWNNSKKLSWLWFCLTFQNNIDYSENRAINIIIKYEKACQQKKQKIVFFTAYLNLMNDELRYNDEQWQKHFLMKIYPALQRKIQEMPVPPIDHCVLIDYAQQLKGLKKYKLKTEPAQSWKKKSHSTQAPHTKYQIIIPSTFNVNKKLQGPSAAALKKDDHRKLKRS